jgi:TPR repeat protein
VIEDQEKAVYWYKKAATQGNADAQYKLGYAYRMGEGVIQDKEKAVYWWKKAAAQGYTLASISLCYAYTRGEGVIQDLEKAVNWMDKALEQDYGMACLIFAEIIEEDYYKNADANTEETKQSYEAVIYWLRESIEHGYEPAQEMLDKFLKKTAKE